MVIPPLLAFLCLVNPFGSVIPAGGDAAAFMVTVDDRLLSGLVVGVWSLFAYWSLRAGVTAEQKAERNRKERAGVGSAGTASL